MKRINSLFLVIFSSAIATESYESWIEKNTFQWKTDKKSELIRKSFLGKALIDNDWLNSSPYYQVFETKEAALACDNFKRTVFAVYSSNGESSAIGYFLNRNSDKVVMIVPPYGADLQHVVRFAGIFKEYDILILKYQTNVGYFSQFYSFVTALCPQRLERGFHQVQAALEWLQKKNYTEIIGCGQSYGSWLMLHAQQNCEFNNKPGFDKLIVDSCPAGARELRQKFIEDPVAVATFGQKQGASYLTMVTNSYYIKQFLLNVSERLFSDISIDGVLKNISVPVLFVHGRSDLLVDKEQFLKMYDSVNHSQKYALVTPFKHLHHSLKSKEVYRFMALNFINGISLYDIEL